MKRKQFVVAASVLTAAFLALIIGRTLTYGPPALFAPGRPDALEFDEKSVAGTLSRAIQIPTISYSNDVAPDRETFLSFHDFLIESFPSVHASMEREVIADYSLLYRWKGTNPELNPILFSAHLDVVPVEPGTEGDWVHPAFSGAIEEGFVWGRGSIDMKQSLVGYMQAAELLIESGFAPERTILFAFGHDEELNSTGAGAIAELLRQRDTRLLFTLDEGFAITTGIVPGVERSVALIGMAEKGYLTVELIATGPGGHSSRPPLAPVNARLARAIVAIENNPRPARMVLPVEQMFEYLAPEMSFTNRVVLANQWLLRPVLMHKLTGNASTNAVVRTTFAPTILESGFKANVLPQTGRAIINFRILPGETVAVIEAYVRDLVAEFGVIVAISGNSPSEPSAIADTGSPSFHTLRQTIGQVFPEVVSAPSLTIGRTDTWNYVDLAENSYRFLPVRLAKDDIKRFHGTNERIAVSNYAEFVRFYVQLMRNAAGAP